MAKFNRISKLYEFYASDLSYNEVEKLIRRDVPEMYDFYVRRMKRPGKTGGSFWGTLKFFRDLFIDFLEQLTPVRRLLYSASLLFFIIGVISNFWDYAVVAFIIVNLLLAFEIAEKLSARDEIEVARDIQNSLIPQEFPKLDSFEISGCSLSANEVGGDYYDFIQTNTNGKTFFVIGDVSGKGMSAALYMIQIRALLINLVEDQLSPKELILSLRRQLDKILQNNSFFTLIAAILEKDKKIKLARAGHMPVIHYKMNEKVCDFIKPSGMAIGIDKSDKFSSALQEVAVEINTGDILVFYTDGITESRNNFGEEFGDTRLQNIIKTFSDRTPKEIVDQILGNISTFTGNSASGDDKTIVIFKAL
ncbi:MAG: PP2C family protein-serine/threonine phosphatase [Ignavibacteriaceae bacterium]|nr:PP2C family protein-serine/threonine phosphatase [Ignavibacteriaceae bacterium]